VGLALAVAGLAVTVARQGHVSAQAPAQAPVAAPAQASAPLPDEAFGKPVNLYARNANPYGPAPQDGELHAHRVRGQVWLITGQPGESNVLVHVGEQGVLMVDSGTQAMAPKLLAQVRQLAPDISGSLRMLRKVINTNGRLDHIGGNEILRKAGGQVIGGEEAAQQRLLGSTGAEIVAHENVLSRLVTESSQPNAPSRELWPTDTEGFDIDNYRFNGEALQIVHPSAANTDGQLMVAFRGSDVIAAGDLIDMTNYPVIDVKRGGTIDGLLVGINNLISMAAPDDQSEGGTIIVPGHGRMIDQSEVALYRNMLTIIRNLVQYYKNEGKTLDEVLALKPSDGYDQRWGKTTGPWTTRYFITAISQTRPAKGPVFFTMKNATLVPESATSSDGKVF
jgi:glyoxylase-like metal-dependent hydrolase (beta-lactamase superfamily II)